MIGIAELFEKCFPKRSKIRRRAGGRRLASVPYQVEMLEQRVLLSATTSASVSDGAPDEDHDHQHAALKGQLTGSEADPSASGHLKYVAHADDSLLKVKIDDVTSVEAGETVEVFVDGSSVGTITIEEMEDGSLGGSLKLNSRDGDAVPTDVEGGDVVEIRTTDESETVLLSGELDSFHGHRGFHHHWRGPFRHAAWSHDSSHDETTALKGQLTGSEADPAASGQVKYVAHADEALLKVKIEDVTSVEAGETVEVFVDGSSVGTITIEEMEDGSLGGSLKLDSNDGDTVPTDVESGDAVEIRTTDESETVLLSGELDSFHGLWGFHGHRHFPHGRWGRFFD